MNKIKHIWAFNFGQTSIEFTEKTCSDNTFSFFDTQFLATNLQCNISSSSLLFGGNYNQGKIQ